MLSNTAQMVRDYDNDHYLHPWEAMWMRGEANRTIATKAEGIYVFDQDGRKLIDGPGGMWCMQLGYGRKDMAETIARQVIELSYHSPWNTASEPGAILARKLAELAPGDINTVCFTTGGSTAVDTAIRTVHFYNNRRGLPNKKIIIGREKGYHGSTFLAASVTGKERDKSWFDHDEERVRLLPNIDPNLRPDGMSLDDWCDAKVADLENEILASGPENVGAFIAEPILASGGVIIPPDGYHKKCLSVCRKYGLLYISDEVVTGFGRLGHWFASKDVFDIEPDMITCAKGLTSGYLPLGACLISDRVMNEITGEGHEDVCFSTGYTYSGHPVSCAAALKTIEIIENEKILEHVREIAPYFNQRLESLKSLPIIADARGIGLVGCIEGRVDIDGDRLELDKNVGYQIDEKCEELGLIVRPLINMCVFSPPLTITRAQIDEMMDILQEAIRQVTKDILG